MATTINRTSPIVRNYVFNNIGLFFEDSASLSDEQKTILSLSLPELTATKHKTYELVKLVNRSNIGGGNVLVKPTNDQLLQIGRAMAQMIHWNYDGQEGGFHILSHKTCERKIRVTLRKGEYGESHYVEEWLNDGWVMSRATSGLIAKPSGNVWWVFGDVYRHFNRLRGGSWNNDTRQIEWYADVPETERGKWHKDLVAFSFHNDLPERVMEAISNSSEWTKYHLTVLFLMGRGVRIHMTGSELSEAQVWEQIHAGFIYETWRLAGFDWDKRPARTSVPLSVTAEDVEAILDWNSFDATIQPDLDVTSINEELSADSEFDAHLDAVVVCEVCGHAKGEGKVCHDCEATCAMYEDGEYAASVPFVEGALGLFS